MPQGQAAVTWSDRKDVELFLTVLAVQKINIDYGAVAAAFGPNIPASCIQSRMKILRKKSAELGITPQDSPAKPSKKRAAPATPTSTAKKSKGKKGALSATTVNNDDDDLDDNNDNEEATPNSNKTPHLSSDEANPAPTKTANNTKRKLAKPRAPRGTTTNKSAAKAKKEAPIKVEAEAEEAEEAEGSLENAEGGVEMEFIKEEKADDEEDGGGVQVESEDENGGDGGLGEGEGKLNGNGGSASGEYV